MEISLIPLMTENYSESACSIGDGDLAWQHKDIVRPVSRTDTGLYGNFRLIIHNLWKSQEMIPV